jgi:hypothetical protein
LAQVLARKSSADQIDLSGNRAKGADVRIDSNIELRGTEDGLGPRTNLA